MLQLNLLPDVKQDYIKAERSKRLVLSVSVIVAASSIGLLLLLFSADRLQRKHIGDLSDDIKTKTAELQKKPQIAKILTVQNQLNSLTGLHKDKPAVSRLAQYLNQVTPTQADISNIKIDFTAQKITITGGADDLSSVNKFIDTLKYTTYRTDKNDANKAFSGVVLTSFDVNSTKTGATGGTKPISYAIDLAYEKDIFDSTQKIELVVPNLTTTRASVDQPTDLFKAAPAPTTKPQGGN